MHFTETEHLMFIYSIWDRIENAGKELTGLIFADQNPFSMNWYVNFGFMLLVLHLHRIFHQSRSIHYVHVEYMYTAHCTVYFVTNWVSWHRAVSMLFCKLQGISKMRCVVQRARWHTPKLQSLLFEPEKKKRETFSHNICMWT